jgi:hypothetical protein
MRLLAAELLLLSIPLAAALADHAHHLHARVQTTNKEYVSPFLILFSFCMTCAVFPIEERDGDRETSCLMAIVVSVRICDIVILDIVFWAGGWAGKRGRLLQACDRKWITTTVRQRH